MAKREKTDLDLFRDAANKVKSKMNEAVPAHFSLPLKSGIIDQRNPETWRIEQTRMPIMGLDVSGLTDGHASPNLTFDLWCMAGSPDDGARRQSLMADYDNALARIVAALEHRGYKVEPGGCDKMAVVAHTHITVTPHADKKAGNVLDDIIAIAKNYVEYPEIGLKAPERWSSKTGPNEGRAPG